jgi:NADH-quinone oxidoreductase subunit L
MESLLPYLLMTLVFLPLGVLLLLGTGWLLGCAPTERTVARITSASFLLCTGAVALVVYAFASEGRQRLTVELGNWFSTPDYAFPLQLLADRVSLPLLAMTHILAGLVGAFSFRYLHRERGFLRFFLFLHLFAFGAALTFAAGSFELLVAGWETVGITSVMLIAFFNDRVMPVTNSLRVFSIYKITDIGLLAGVFLIHHFASAESAHFLFGMPTGAQHTGLRGAAAVMAGALLVFAAAGKSAQFPFCGWLPRAMEGPTPSSAIFYGAVAVHMGVYLLLRAEPVLQSSPYLPPVVVALGLITALQATLCGRAAADVKTMLSWAALAQVGVIFMEVGFGWETLALSHTLAHATLRTLQFLRAPSMLHDDHRIHAAAGGQLAPTGLHYQALLPGGVRSWLYRLALDHCHLDTLLDRFVAGPFLHSAERLASFERGEELMPGKRQVERPLRPELVGEIDA